MTGVSVQQLASAVAALPEQAKAVATSIQQVLSVTHAMTYLLRECIASEPCDCFSLVLHDCQCQYVYPSALQTLLFTSALAHVYQR